MSKELAILIARLESMSQEAIALLPNIALSVAVFVFFMILGRLAFNGVKSIATRTGQPQAISIILGRTVRWIILLVGFLVAATVVFPTLTAASLFSALGISGIAVGFAFKDIFQNLLAGVLIIITRPFRIGDQISSAGHEGTVEDIQIRATLLRTYDNRRVVIPNSELFTNRVVVNTAYSARRLAVPLSIGNKYDITQAKQVILNAIEGVANLKQDPRPVVLVRELGSDRVNLEVRFWIESARRGDAMEAEDAAQTNIKQALSAAGIGYVDPAAPVTCVSPPPA